MGTTEPTKVIILIILLDGIVFGSDHLSLVKCPAFNVTSAISLGVVSVNVFHG